MSLEIIIVLVLLTIAVVLFTTERLPVDLVALIILATLLGSGIISPEEGLSGFSNTATVTVAAMFILSAGLFKTGAVNFIGSFLTRVGKNSTMLVMFTVMITVGIMSAFINNTAAVAIFLPIVIGVAQSTKTSPSKFLMPLSFASMFGGVCTLIGTSTNILVSSIAERHGLEPFGMFEFSALGLVFFVVGIFYMMTIGIRLIPGRRTWQDLTETFGMGDYLTEVVLLPGAKSIGKKLTEAPIVHDLDLAILEVVRNKIPMVVPSPDTILQENDVLRVRCKVEKIRALQERAGITLKARMQWSDEDFDSEQALLVEAVVAPNSVLEGRTLQRVQFRRTFGAIVLAIRHRSTLMRENVGKTRLHAGDVLLIEVKRDHFRQLKQHQALVIVSEMGLQKFRKRRVIPATLIMLGVVATAALNILPIVVSAIIGCVLLILTKCLTLEETYQAIEWSVIFLLAGVITLAVALEKTGAAELISSALVNVVGDWGPTALMSTLFLATMLLTSIMSNAATAALLAPIAIVAAGALEISPRPLLMAVTFAASLSFMDAGRVSDEHPDLWSGTISL